ncbi:MAG: phosphodiester glycosidase family protein [Firmicutes bacterium]|nr:phosphodiester glycosidase family protein [Bacillota bacterium]
MSGFGPRCAVCTILAALVFLSALGGAGVKCADPAGNAVCLLSGSETVRLGTKTIRVNYVKVNLHDPRVSLRVVLGQDKVGATEDLLAMARRVGARVAINGTFFNAYVDGPYKDPVGTLITGGEFVHRGATGTVFAVADGNEVRMESARFKIVGATDGLWKWPGSWYSYWLNRTPTSQHYAGIFTPARGKWTGAAMGVSIVVRDGVVVAIGRGEQEIPKDGYVINFQGSEEALASRFAVGTAVEYKVVMADGSDRTGFWGRVREGLGAGPKLVSAGKVTYSAESAREEGFTEAKILSMSSARSGLALTKDGSLLMVTCPAATMAEFAQTMHALGAAEAMNLDGGASSGLVHAGGYLTSPGRALSNALVVLVDAMDSRDPR